MENASLVDLDCLRNRARFSRNLIIKNNASLFVEISQDLVDWLVAGGFSVKVSIDSSK